MPKRVLIVDDETDIVDVVAMYIQKEGYEIEFALDGLDALKKISCNKPDIIILDVMLPKMDGYEVNRKLKENIETKSIPVIIISGKGDTRDIMKQKEDGKIYDFLSKPFKMKDLLSKTRQCL